MLAPFDEKTTRRFGRSISRSSSQVFARLKRELVMADDYPKQRLVLHYIQTCGVLLVATSIWVSVHSIDVQVHWNRQRLTFDLLGKYTSELKEHAPNVYNAYPGLNDPTKGGAPSPQEAQILATAEEGVLLPDGKSSAATVRRHLNAVLNYFEELAYAWESETCERDPIEQEVAPGIVRWTDFFANYIQVQDALNQEPNWPPLSRVVKIWKSKGHERLYVVSIAAPSPVSTPTPP